MHRIEYEEVNRRRKLFKALANGGKPATTGMMLVTGNTIVTGADGQVIYVTGQDAFLQRSNSTAIKPNRKQPAESCGHSQIQHAKPT